MSLPCVCPQPVPAVTLAPNRQGGQEVNLEEKCTVLRGGIPTIIPDETQKRDLHHPDAKWSLPL